MCGAKQVEHPFGTIKVRVGATHFAMKTLPKVATEMALTRVVYVAQTAYKAPGVGSDRAAAKIAQNDRVTLR